MIRPDLGRCPACGTIVHCDGVVECPSPACRYQPDAVQALRAAGEEVLQS